MKRPKAPKPTAQELAGVARQSRMIDEETEELEKRLKAAARGKYGNKSMLGPAINIASVANSTSRGGGYGAGGTGRASANNSFLSGASGGGVSSRFGSGAGVVKVSKV